MSPQKIYQTRAEGFAARESELGVQSERLSNYRLATFVGGLSFGAIASVGVQSLGWMAAYFGLSLLFFSAFVFLVIKHRRVSREQSRSRLLKEHNQFGVHRLNREWDQFPVPEAPAELQQLPLARDLDLFGKASLFQLISTQRTPQGRATLAHWLTDSMPSGSVSERQEAVESLSPHLDWRQNLAVMGEDLSDDQAVIIPRWIGKPLWLIGNRKLKTYLRCAPWISLGSLLLTVFFWPLPFVILPFSFHLSLIRKNKGRIERSLEGLVEGDRRIRSYCEVFEYLEHCPSTSGLLSTLIPRVREAQAAMDELNTTATWAAFRGSLIHPILNAFLAFDLHTVARLENWQRNYEDHFPEWFEALGEIEALASLAGLRHDEPDWVAPELATSGKLVARDLGHPLIDHATRVCNDVSLGPEGRFLLVTGSNMAGKSTLLRAIGLNMILAQCGAPVCARSMSAPPLTIATSMAIQDSLADGLSFFMAELQRIKEIVNLTIEEREHGRTVLFLLDEILQGTNTVERREIVQRVLANLVSQGAIGAVTTHDLALAESDDLTRNADLIHFRERFEYAADGKPTMTFDYKIRPGIATTTNALKILELIEMPV